MAEINVSFDFLLSDYRLHEKPFVFQFHRVLLMHSI